MSTAMLSAAADWREALASITPRSELAALLIDDVEPAIQVSPPAPQSMGGVLALAAAHSLVVTPAGSGTKLHIGGIPERSDILLRTDRLNSVSHYDPGDLTIGVQAGMTVATLQQVLAEHHQFLPFDVAQPDRATVGGLLATNAHGPLKAGYGGVRDCCIGIHFATADGRLVKGGGKVVKNVAGYDLMKLMIGSFGTLGVITSANFKVFPRPRQTRTFIGEFKDVEAALAARDRVLRSPLGTAFMCLELVSPAAEEYLQPRQVRDPDHYAPSAPIARSAAWKLCLRASASDRVLSRYRSELGSDFNQELGGNDEAAFWEAISNFETEVAARHRNAMILRLNSPLAFVAAALASAERAARDNNFIFTATGRAFPGALLIALVPLAVDPPNAMQYAKAVSALRSGLPRDATAVVARCPVEAKRRFDVWGSSPADLAAMQAVKKALDPADVLNRGRFVF